jgi:hypothetical protein
MMDETQERITADRGDRAQRLLEDPLIREALKAIRDKAILRFVESRVDSERDRLIARLQIDAAEEFVNALLHHVRNGTLAKSNLEKLRGLIRRR